MNVWIIYLHERWKNGHIPGEMAAGKYSRPMELQERWEYTWQSRNALIL